jgi:hypothetical protein
VNIHNASNGTLVTNLPTGIGIAHFVAAGNELVAAGLARCTFWRVGTWEFLGPASQSARIGGDLVGFWPGTNRALFSNTEKDLALRLRELESGRELAAFTLPEGSTAWACVFDQPAERMVLAGGVPFVRIWQFAELRRELRRLGLDWPGTAPGADFTSR